MSNIPTPEDLYSDQTEHMGNTAIKFTFTEQLVKELDLYAKGCGKSKAEIAREAIEAKINGDLMWQAKLFFFLKNNGKTNDEKIEILNNSSRGTLLKIAAFQYDVPDKANILICNFIRIKGKQISLEIPNTFRPTPLIHNAIADTTNVKMMAGKLVIPQMDSAKSEMVQQNRLIYTIDVDYIWDIDNEIPKFISG